MGQRRLRVLGKGAPKFKVSYKIKMANSPSHLWVFLTITVGQGLNAFVLLGTPYSVRLWGMVRISLVPPTFSVVVQEKLFLKV